MDKSLEEIALDMRCDILTMCYRLKENAAHLGGCLSLVELLAVLYKRILMFKTADLEDEERDRVIMSKGHGSIALYSAMYQAGIIEDLSLVGNLLGEKNEYYKQVVRNPKLGFEFSSGSLGQGLAYGIGIAWALKRKKNNTSKVYVIIGDGECDEGSVWESASIASHLELNNIVVIIDRNGLQIDGFTEEINKMYRMRERWEAFGFETLEIDGHDVEQIEQAFKRSVGKKPFVIIAKTIKGRGISFTENNVEWHQNVVTDELYEKGMKELSRQIERGRKDAEV